MDKRILFAIVVGLILAAFGGFYIAFSPGLDEAVTPLPVPVATAPKLPATSTPVAPAVTAPAPPMPVPATPTPPASATPPSPPDGAQASIEAEIAMSDFAELQALLKVNFSDEYSALIAFAVRRRNEGVPDQQFGQEILERIQGILRSKLKFGSGASMATVDRLAANEKSLFHALGTDSAEFCLQMLGNDPPPATPPPEHVRRMMALGTFYRFQAAVEGMPKAKPAEPLKPEETKAYETALNGEGLNLKEVSSGAYLNQTGGDPGKPCLTLEKLHRAIATLPDGTRRKIYDGMFFVGRDR